MPFEDKLHRIYLSKRSIDNWLKREVMAKDNFSCHYCSAPLSSPLITHIDHATPRSQGGLTVLENLRASCQKCNSEKGERMEEEYFLSMNVRRVLRRMEERWVG